MPLEIDRFETIGQAFRTTAAENADREAIYGEGHRWTWAELADRVDEAARAFIAAGVQHGDRVAIWAPNSPRWIVASVALQSIGASLVPLNTRYKGAEASHVLRRSRARVLVTVNGFLGADYLKMLEGHDLPSLRTKVVITGAIPSGAISWDDFIAAGASVTSLELSNRFDAVQSTDISDIVFTSGTTGAPKGVLGTHYQALHGMGLFANIVGIVKEDRYLLVNPLFHVFGYKGGIIVALLTGCTLLPIPVFDVDAALELISRERVTCLPGPPTIYYSLLRHPRLGELDISSLSKAVTGAAPIPPQLVRDMQSKLGFDTVITAYGLTENMGLVSMSRRGDSPETIARTTGRPMPGCEVRVVDAAGDELPNGELGEIVVRGWAVMTGYLDDPGATAEAIDPDGWLHTGDIGMFDADGNVLVTDRLKDMFIVGGFNAYPAEIENLLLNHPGIAQVAVIGVPDDRLGEVGVAFVVPAAGDEGLDAAQVISWARANMANFKVPRVVHVLDSLPVGPTNKVLKAALRDMAPRLRSS